MSLVAFTAVVLGAAAPHLANAHGVSASPQPQLRRVHGHVNSVNGTRLAFHAAAGRILDVDMSDVRSSVRRALAPNERLTLVGVPGPRRNEFHAQFVQPDNPNRAAQARVNDTGIHGTVESVRGNTLPVRADDGRLLSVDTADASRSVERALRPGDPVEVVGHFGADRNHLIARWIQQDTARGGSVASR